MDYSELLRLLGKLLLATVSAVGQLQPDTAIVDTFTKRPASDGRPEISVPAVPVRSEPKATPRPRASTSGWKKDPEVSWYGPGFYGKRTACGLAYTKTIMGVAHRTLPCGTLVEFRYKGRSKEVPVIDRGPYVEGRTWDISGGLCTYLRHCFTGPIEWRFK